VNPREFLAEAAEIVEALASGISSLDAGLHSGKINPALVNDVFRAAHSLKGLAGLFGVNAVGELAHTVEDLLDALRLGKVRLNAAVLAVLEQAVDLFQELLAHNGSNDARFVAEMAALTDRMAAVRAADPGPVILTGLQALELSQDLLSVLTEYEEHRLCENANAGTPLFLVHAPMALDDFDVALAKLTEALKQHGEVVSTLPSPERTPGMLAFDILFAAPMDAVTVRAHVASISPEYAVSSVGPRRPFRAPPGPGDHDADETMLVPTATALLTETVRVDIEKLDRLMNVVGEIALVKGGMAKVVEVLAREGERSRLVPELQKLTRSLERKIDELQTGIMEARMVPLAQMFEKMRRIARQLARELGKQMEFQVDGQHTELDKLLMEQLSDPLVHLVRNAVDHGLESPEARRRAGKPSAGKLTIRAQPRGNQVLISVEDDGRGLDEVAIKRAALENGLVTDERVGSLSSRDIWNLIFVPGFSTKRQATGVSGRGVGMDVVKTNIARLSGVIDIESAHGAGTRFQLTVPITLAILQSLIIRVRRRTFALPLAGVSEIFPLDATRIRTVEGREVFQTRTLTIPLLGLGQLLGLSGEDSPRGFVILLSVGLNRVGLRVDDLLGRQDIVIRPLGRLLQGLRGIAGATDLGEPSGVLVLDVGALVEEALGASAAA
jgi:two-component system chemotaxis sensor kinase CheA